MKLDHPPTNLLIKPFYFPMSRGRHSKFRPFNLFSPFANGNSPSLGLYFRKYIPLYLPDRFRVSMDPQVATACRSSCFTSSRPPTSSHLTQGTSASPRDLDRDALMAFRAEMKSCRLTWLQAYTPIKCGQGKGMQRHFINSHTIRSNFYHFKSTWMLWEEKKWKTLLFTPLFF